MSRVEHRCTIKTPVEEIFDYVVDPANRTEWQESCLEIRNVSRGPIGLGTTWTEKQKIGGRIVEYKVQITEFSRPKRWAMSLEIAGARGKFINIFDTEGDTTTVSIIMEYKMPGSLFGRFAEKIMFERLASKICSQDAASLKFVMEKRRSTSQNESGSCSVE